MDKNYTIRFIIFFALSYLVMQATMKWIMPPQPTTLPATTTATAPTTTTGTLQTTTTATLAAATPAATTPPTIDPATLPPAPTVALKTDNFDVEFSTRGGVPLRWDVIDPRYMAHAQDERGQPIRGKLVPEPLIDPDLPATRGLPAPFSLSLQEANAGFLTEFSTAIYTGEGPLLDGKPGWRFTSPANAAGLSVVRTWRFQPGSYVAGMEVELRNAGPSTISFAHSNGGGLGFVLGPGVGKPLPADNPVSRFVKVDAVLRDRNGFNYKHVGDTSEEGIYEGSTFDWGGIQGLYFMSILIPSQSNPITAARVFVDPDVIGPIATQKNQGQFPSLELFGAPFKLEPGQSAAFKYDVFMGPKQRSVLHEVGHDLPRVLFHDSYWWMRYLCLGMMAIMTWFHGIIGNWGVAIMLLTVTVRLLVFPLVHKGMKAQAKMVAEQTRIKPLMDKINEKWKEDPVRRQQEVMKLYREHNINPFGMFKGCLWMMIQIPIFFALYKLLSHSIDLRGAPFLWVDDLSQADKLITFAFKLPLMGQHFNLLPLLVAVTQLLSSKFMSQPATDPQQAQMQKMMIYMMPAMLLVFTYGFPAGLMLYWLVSNLWQVVQQLWVNKHMPKPQPLAPANGTVPAK